jgi:hypothetical protein
MQPRGRMPRRLTSSQSADLGGVRQHQIIFIGRFRRDSKPASRQKGTDGGQAQKGF